MPAFIGIDPGKRGCLCLLQDTGDCSFYDWPKDGNLIVYYRNLSDVVAKNDIRNGVLEKVHAMPKQGVSSMFTFGTNFGVWLGWCSAWAVSWDFSYMLVSPQTWMKGLLSKADGSDTKTQVGNAAQRMFPKAELTGPRGGYLDGRGDSLLMAYFAMLQSKDGGILGQKKKSKRVSRVPDGKA